MIESIEAKKEHCIAPYLSAGHSKTNISPVLLDLVPFLQVVDCKDGQSLLAMLGAVHWLSQTPVCMYTWPLCHAAAVMGCHVPSGSAQLLQCFVAALSSSALRKQSSSSL